MNGLETLLAASLLVGSMTPTPSVSDNRSKECLAMNMYHEARNQGTAGILAVSAVVFNRVNDSRFPNTICGVVEQGPTRASWKDPKVRFMKTKYDMNDLDYWDYPWEIEAFGKQLGLFVRFCEDTGIANRDDMKEEC